MRSSSNTPLRTILLLCRFVLSLCVTLIPAVGFTATLTPGGSGVVYYVNSGSGNDAYSGTSTRTPFKTISRAARLVNAGDIVYVMAGTYSEQVYLNRSGSASKGYITFQAYPGAKPVITKYNQFAAFNFASNESYIIIDGFKIVGDAQSVTLAQAKALGHNTSSTVNNGSCITAKGNHVVIRNNELSYCPGAGLGVSGDYFYVYNNIVHHNSFWSPVAASGISIRGRDSDSSTATKIWVYNNTVYGNQNYICNVLQTNPCRITDGEGIIADSNVDSAFRGRTLIYNNVVYNNGGPGLEAYRSKHVDLINNTTYMNNQSALQETTTQAHATKGEVEVGSSSDVRVLNNILYSRPSGAMDYLFSNTSLTWDYNLHYNSTGNLIGLGNHNLIANPLFQDPTHFNFRLNSGSPALKGGTTYFTPAVGISTLAVQPSANMGASIQ